jgi:predicted esterase
VTGPDFIVQTFTIPVRTHGRYLVDRPDGDGPFPLLVGFHGYGENADDMLRELAIVRGERPWLVVSVQALHRFYNRTADVVVASWMTRQDREHAIDDNAEYVRQVVAQVRTQYATRDAIVYAGFSQGVAMAYRAAARLEPARGVIALAGDVPPDVAAAAARLPPVLIGRGTADKWYTESKARADEAVLRAADVPVTMHVFEGGHEWAGSFRERAALFLDGAHDR